MTYRKVRPTFWLRHVVCRIAAVSTVSSLVLGCGSTKIESVSDASRAEPFSRLYVVVVHQKVERAVVDQIVDGIEVTLTRKFDSASVVMELQSVITNESGELTLDEAPPIDIQRLRDFVPDALLEIELASIAWEVRATGAEHLRNLTYDVQLTAVGSESPFWRAQVKNAGYGQINAGWREMGVTTATRIIEQLAQDGMLAPKGSHPLRPAG